MPILGKCALCGLERQLQKSHYLPKALYPTRRQKSATLTRGTVVAGAPGRHLKDHLLCQECETRFEQNGESEVLRVLAPKNAKLYSLNDRLRVALAREQFPELSRFAAYEIGLDAAKFAYFAVSVIWRGAVHQWTLPDGSLTTLLDLGTCEGRIREYLLGRSEFPSDILSVIVIVCSDNESRSVLSVPDQFTELNCRNYRFIARGVTFRVLLGDNIPSELREQSCVSARECISYANCRGPITRGLSVLLTSPVK